MKEVKVEDLQCDECGGYADVVLIDTVGPIRAVRFLCNECRAKEPTGGI